MRKVYVKVEKKGLGSDEDILQEILIQWEHDFW
jgi:hypothetical protein